MDKTKNNKNEKVLVFPSIVLDNLLRFQGLEFNVNKYLSEIESCFEFIERRKIEYNFNYKQVINYIILFCKDKIFSYRRGLIEADKRVSFNLSIGIGGHIAKENNENLNKSIFSTGMESELNEEVDITTEFKTKLVALINDDSDDVGKVHFGIIYLIDLKTQSIKAKEDIIEEPNFVTLEELKKNLNQYESWSRICIDNLGKLIDLKDKS